MLQTPAELRELARRYRKVAKSALTAEDRRKVAGFALALAQLAEAIERDRDALDHMEGDKLQFFEALLAQSAAEKSLLQMIQAQDEHAPAKRRQIWAWRLRAEELRTAADNFSVPSAKESLRRAAANYEQLADTAERDLSERPTRRGKTKAK